jgi:hypothetical protein
MPVDSVRGTDTDAEHHYCGTKHDLHGRFPRGTLLDGWLRNVSPFGKKTGDETRNKHPTDIAFSIEQGSGMSCDDLRHLTGSVSSYRVPTA